jgi:hypothetical protein
MKKRGYSLCAAALVLSSCIPATVSPPQDRSMMILCVDLTDDTRTAGEWVIDTIMDQLGTPEALHAFTELGLTKMPDMAALPPNVHLLQLISQQGVYALANTLDDFFESELFADGSWLVTKKHIGFNPVHSPFFVAFDARHPYYLSQLITPDCFVPK